MVKQIVKLYENNITNKEDIKNLQKDFQINNIIFQKFWNDFAERSEDIFDIQNDLKKMQIGIGANANTMNKLIKKFKHHKLTCKSIPTSPTKLNISFF